MQRRNFRNRNDLSHTKPQKMLMMMQWTLMGIMLLQQIKTIDSVKFKGDSCVSKNEPGICKEWGECSIIKTLIESGQYTNREVVGCGFGIKEELICCPVRADPSPNTTTVKTEDRSNEPSTIMATTQAPERDFWLDLLENTTTTTTTEKPDFWLDLLTTATPTTTTTTTTLKPLVIGDQRLNESSEFFDFNALLGGNQSGGAKQERQTNSNSVTPNNILPNPGFVSPNGNGNGNLNTGPVNFNQWNLRQPTNNFNGIPGLPNNNGRGNNGPNNIHFGWGSPNNGRVPLNGPPNFNRGHTMGRGPSSNGRGRGSQNNWRGRNSNNGIGNQNRGFMFPENSEGQSNFFGNGEPLNRRPGRPVNNIEEQNPNNSNNNNNDDDKIDELIKDLFGSPNEANINSQASTALDQEKPRELALEDSLANIFNIDKPQNPSAQQPVHWLTPQNSNNNNNNNNNNHEVEYARHYGPRHQIVFTNPQAAGQFHTMPAVENPISNNNQNVAPSTSFIQQPVVVETWSTSPVLTPNGFNPVQEVYQNLVNSGMDIVQAQPDEIQPSHVVFVQHQQQSPQFVQQPDVIYQPQSFDHSQQMESLRKEHRSTPPLQQFVQQTNGDGPVHNIQSPPSQILDPFKPFEFRPPLGDENNLIEDNTSLSTNTNLPTPDVKTNAERPSVRACRRIENGLTAALTPHIIGGIPAEMEEFPHMVAIGYSRIGGDNRPPYDIRCGGTLIDKRFVLTAAHCVAERENVPSIVRLGLVNLTDPDQMRDAVELRIKETYIHDDYFARFTYNDIAILELEREVEFSKNIYPVCLYTDEKDPGPNIKLWVTGWGTVNITTRSFSNILLKAPLHISPLENCNKSFTEYGSNRKIPDGIIRTQLCAEDKDQTKDACQGDSGGPLVLVVDESYKNYRLVGVVSSGFGCASSTPGLYTRVAAFLDFIEKIVWPNGGE